MADELPPGDSASAVTPALRGVPTWLLALAVVLPSLALIAVAWLVMSGVFGGQGPAAGSESPPAGGVEQTPPPPDAGAEAAAAAEPRPDDRVQDPPAEPEPQPVSTPTRTTAANRGGNRSGGRLADNPRVRDGIPEELQRLMDSGRVHTGAVVVSSPFAVALRIAPADRSVIPPQMQERIRNATTQEERRRISASVMAGFLMPEAGEHRIELPVGTWRVNVLAPPLLLNHAQQVVVRATSDARVEFPTRVVTVVIESDPSGARVRVNGLLPISTPYRGSMVMGDHEFQFIWGDQTSMTRAKIERDGQTIIGRRRR